MGAACAKGGQISILGGGGHRGDGLREGSGGGGGAGGRAIPQILMLGPPGSGKSTLMYRTVLPEWTTIASEMEPTKCGFHYEEICIGDEWFGLWEVAGDLTELWPLFYQSVEICVVVYVVSLMNVDEESIGRCRRFLRMLVNEDVLSQAYFCVVMNTFDMERSSLADPNDMASRLGVGTSDLPVENAQRVMTVMVNAKDGIQDAAWNQTLTSIAAMFGRRARRQRAGG